MARQATLEDAYQALDRVGIFTITLTAEARASLSEEDLMVLGMLFIDSACGCAQNTSLVCALLHFAIKGRTGGGSA